MGIKDIGNMVDKAVAAGKNVTDGGLSKMVALINNNEGGKVDANTRNDMFKKICAFIPGKVDNDLVVQAFEWMRKAQKMVKKDYSSNSAINKKVFEMHEKVIAKANGYVENQNAYTDMKYGASTMQYSGCEVFATYNAIYNITGKYDVRLPEMIAAYEKDGMVLSGKFGTSPRAIEDYLQKRGFKTAFTTKEKEFDTIGKTYQSCILTMYNDKNDISQEVHTVNISKDKDKYTAHNVYCNGTVVGPYGSVTEVIKNINKGKAKGISLIGVKK